MKIRPLLITASIMAVLVAMSFLIPFSGTLMPYLLVGATMGATGVLFPAILFGFGFPELRWTRNAIVTGVVILTFLALCSMGAPGAIASIAAAGLTYKLWEQLFPGNTLN